MSVGELQESTESITTQQETSATQTMPQNKSNTMNMAAVSNFMENLDLTGSNSLTLEQKVIIYSALYFLLQVIIYSALYFLLLRGTLNCGLLVSTEQPRSHELN